MSTSFKKKCSAKLPYGSKLSLHSKQLLVSSGIPSLDAILNGGISVGTIILVEEDEYGTYADVMQRLFLAEGVACDNSLFIATAEKSIDNILKNVPADTVRLTSSNIKNNQSEEVAKSHDLKIAWRYQNQLNIKDSPVSPVSNNFGQYFDLSNTLTEDTIKKMHKCNSFTLDGLPPKSTSKTLYENLLKSISENILKEKTQTSPSVLRISLQSLNSPFWVNGYTKKYNPSLARFLLCLKSKLRSSLSCCMVTVPTHMMEDCYISRIRDCCDTVIRLESFPVTKCKDEHLYKEYSGFLKVIKLARLNCIVGPDINTTDLVFKLKRKKFSIEKIHLYPDISETASRSQNTSSIKPGTPLCSMTSPTNNKLDF